MPQQNNNAKDSLLKLEKHVKKILRKSLKDNTLDYTIQFTVSSLDPGKVKYAAQISAPAKGVQPITFIFDTYKDLETSLQSAVDVIDRRKVEVTFHQSRITTLENKIKQHQDRIDKLNDPEYDETEDNIALEQIS